MKPQNPPPAAPAVLGDALTGFSVEALRRCGMTDAEARLAADGLVTTGLWAVHSHGTKSPRLYLIWLREGGLKARGVRRKEAQP